MSCSSLAAVLGSCTAFRRLGRDSHQRLGLGVTGCIMQGLSLHGEVSFTWAVSWAVCMYGVTKFCTVSFQKPIETTISAPVLCLLTKVDALRNIFSDSATTHIRTAQRSLLLLSASIMGFASRQCATSNVLESLPSSQLRNPVPFLWHMNLRPHLVA